MEQQHNQKMAPLDTHLEQTGHHSAGVAARLVLYVCAELDGLAHDVALQIRRGCQDDVATFHKLVVELLGDGHGVGLLQDRRDRSVGSRESGSLQEKRFKTEQKYLQRTSNMAMPQTTGLNSPSPQFYCPINLLSPNPKYLQAPEAVGQHVSLHENPDKSPKATHTRVRNHLESVVTARQER